MAGPVANIEKIIELEIYRDSRNLYQAQVCRIEGRVYAGFTLFFFNAARGSWCPTKKNFYFPAAIWPAFVEVIPNLSKLFSGISLAQGMKK